MRKNIQDRINELKQSKKVDSLPEGTHEKIENQNYTKESMINNLFKDNTSDFIGDFEELKKNEQANLLYIHVDKYASEFYDIPQGSYIALGKEPVDLEDYILEVEDMGEEPISKGTLDYVNNCELLFRIGDDSVTQGEMVQKLEEGLKVKEVEDIGDNKILMSNAKVDYLEIVDQNYFDNRIDEVLSRYKELNSPDEDIKRSLKYKELLEGNKKMVFCPIIDREVYIFEGEK